jgi:hypothetical protein
MQHSIGFSKNFGYNCFTSLKSITIVQELKYVQAKYPAAGYAGSAQASARIHTHSGQNGKEQSEARQG